jgi:ABC-type glucose/galactose transport system permease subunit
MAIWVLLHTHLGNWILAVDGSSSSSRAVGTPVNRMKIGLFLAVGLLCWFTGMQIQFAFNTVQSGIAIGNEFIYIVAARVGGCLLTGGYGSAIGRDWGVHLRHGPAEYRLRRLEPPTGSASSWGRRCSAPSRSTTGSAKRVEAMR